MYGVPSNGLFVQYTVHHLLIYLQKFISKFTHLCPYFFSNIITTSLTTSRARTPTIMDPW